MLKLRTGTLNMSNTELNLTEIKREELRTKRNKNIMKAIIGLVIIFILFIIGNKAYDRYRENIYRDKLTIISQNETLLRDFNSYLEYVNQIITDLLFDEEFESDFVRGRLSQMRENISNLFYVRYDYQKYNIDRMRLNDFFHDSSSTISWLLEKNSVSP